jgi:hypothetical protein
MVKLLIGTAAESIAGDSTGTFGDATTPDNLVIGWSGDLVVAVLIDRPSITKDSHHQTTRSPNH